MKVQFAASLEDALSDSEAKRDFNRSLFTAVAPRYDFVTRALSLGRDAAWKRRLVRALPPLDAPACADLACGTGDVTRLLAKRYPGGRIEGLDLTPGMLDLARRLTPHGPVSYRLGDMQQLPWADASLDIVTGSYALRNAPDLDQAIAEVGRVVKPGGYAAFLDFSKPRSPGLQAIGYAVLKAWGGLWGLLLHRNADVYGYIAESLRRYPDREELRSRFLRDGWTVRRRKLLYLGLLEILVLEKQAVT